MEDRDLAPATSLVSPHGYPQLGLYADHPLRYKEGDTGEKARAWVESFEHSLGNTSFQAYRLDKVEGSIAHELANVYVSLRQYHPLVRPDWVNFAAWRMEDKRAYGETYGYHTVYPHLRPVLAAVCAPVDEQDEISRMVIDDLLEDGDDFMAAALFEELSLLKLYDTQDVTSTGTIRIWSGVSTLRRQKSTLRLRQKENVKDYEKGRPLANLPTCVNWATYVLLHEFGHLVDAVVWQTNRAPSVYGPLSTALVEEGRPNQLQWSKHLANYPTTTFMNQYPGPAAGGKARGKIVKKSLKGQLAQHLGPYGTMNREEMFAEAFAAAWSASDPTLRRRLEVFQRSAIRASN
jgi:hypothetical protein